MDAGMCFGDDGFEESDSEVEVDGFDEAYVPNMRSDGRSTGSGDVCAWHPDQPQQFHGSYTENVFETHLETHDIALSRLFSPFHLLICKMPTAPIVRRISLLGHLFCANSRQLVL